MDESIGHFQQPAGAIWRFVHKALLLTQERAGQRPQCVARPQSGSFANMRRIPALLAVSLLMGAASCEKDEGALVSSGVSIGFRTDSGYVYMGDTVHQGDTLRIGAIIIEGSDDLERFYLSVSYDNDTGIGQDTVNVNVNPFSYEAVHVTRFQPGTEQVIFTVEEPDGDRTSRRLTFIVP